jgi:xanthine dehydrogenase molybdenum-binding subunit
MYQPPAMRWRGITVLTNTPPRVSQSQPGGMQGITLMEPIWPRLRASWASIRWPSTASTRPEGKAHSGPPPGQRQARLCHQRVRQRKRSTAARSSSMGGAQSAQPKKSGTKVRGVGVSMSCFVGGSVGFDGLFVIKPDGRLYIPVRHRQSRHRVGERRSPRDR